MYLKEIKISPSSFRLGEKYIYQERDNFYLLEKRNRLNMYDSEVVYLGYTKVGENCDLKDIKEFEVYSQTPNGNLERDSTNFRWMLENKCRLYHIVKNKFYIDI